MKRLIFLSLLALSSPAQAGPPTKCLPASVKAKLAYIDKHFGHVIIISTYRKNARIAGSGKRSLHASCKAADFLIVRNKQAAIQWLRKQPVEVITYGCAMHHVHVGVGSYKGHHCVNARGVRR